MTTVMTNSPTTTVVAKDCVVEESSPPKYVSSQKRCAEYTPSLEELKDTTFEEYVRGEILGVPLPGYEFLYVYEDKDGREMKREVPVGQHYAGGRGEDADSVAQAVTSSDESSSRSTPPPPPPKKKVDETRTTRSQIQATPPRKKKEDEARTTRSQSQAKRGIYPASSKNNTIPSSEPPHERYRMCFHKLRDGMAKVTLPTGFWAKTDTTARGRLVSVSFILFFFYRLSKHGEKLTLSITYISLQLFSRNYVSGEKDPSWVIWSYLHRSSRQLLELGECMNTPSSNSHLSV